MKIFQDRILTNNRNFKYAMAHRRQDIETKEHYLHHITRAYVRMGLCRAGLQMNLVRFVKQQTSSLMNRLGIPSSNIDNSLENGNHTFLTALKAFIASFTSFIPPSLIRILSTVIFYSLWVASLCLGTYFEFLNWFATLANPLIVPILNRAVPLSIIKSYTSKFAFHYMPELNEAESLVELSQFRDELIDILAVVPLISKLIVCQPPAVSSGIQAADPIHISHFFNLYADGHTSEPLSFSFSSAGWMIFYEIGVAKCLKDLIRYNTLRDAIWIGNGSGSIVAAAMSLDVDLDLLRWELMDIANASSSKLFGSLGLSNAFVSAINKLFKNDIRLCEGRLGISVMKLPILSSRFISEFPKKQV